MDGEGNLESGATGIINFTKNGGQQSQQLPNLSGHVHRLPCCIKYDGPCAVSHYFKPKSTGREANELIVEESYFRGRKLHGATLRLPPDYSGLILGKKNVQRQKASDLSEQNSFNCWEVNAEFENITYWNHESLPSQDDTFFRSFHWLSIAEANGTLVFGLCQTQLILLHKPVKVEDLASVSHFRNKAIN